MSVAGSPARFNLTERAWESVDEPGTVVVMIEGSRESIEAWRASEERASLAAELGALSVVGNWLTEEMTLDNQSGSSQEEASPDS